ncbi:hypothetical protein H8B06_03790 [Sphingobacterium sp. DN00404]|uniref:DUF5018 domain-containing protein n=1 Tax=Sphingobacterium micropteri TaxID=2763501 RepID=A0ABR7YL79_9SPHI|nr:hypothetical protein [Sphingobacterium micropteri]MBD1431938.1 hypothetical protein [Sphingobacterium micropteri]
MYKILSLICLSTVLFFTQSCSKTEYEQLKRPYADIQAFTIAGYGLVDSIDAVIAGDSITIYWDDAVPLPAEISPSISLSAGATIEPKANVSVPFSRNTIYIVTAENGDKREYRLVPKKNREIPRLQGLLVDAFAWLSRPEITLRGEYFMAAPLDQYKVYMQRLRDGVEFDLEIDPSTITPHQINAKLPAFTMEQDTGLHRIWVDLGGVRTESLELDLYQPTLKNEQYTIAYPSGTQTVGPGQTITIQHEIKDESDGAAARYYLGENILHIRLGIRPSDSNGALQYHEVDIESITESSVTFKIPSDFSQYIDYDIISSQVIYKAYTMGVMWGSYTTAISISSGLPQRAYIKIAAAE